MIAGHSLGGLFAEYFAAKHATEVAGLILEESGPADFSRRCRAAHAEPCVAPAAVIRFMPSGARREYAALDSTMNEVEAAGQIRNVPVLILSRPVSADSKPFDRLWQEAQNDLAARYPSSEHLNARGGGHYIHKDERAWFLESVTAFLNRLR